VADVVSRNCYRAEFFAMMDPVHQGSGRPVLNGEFPSVNDSLNGIRNPIEPPGGYGAWDRFACRRRFAIDYFFTHPGLVGYTFYKWGGAVPAFGQIRWLAEANYRAIPIAVQWDRPPVQTHEPLNGQFFLTLEAAIASVQKLRPPDPNAEPSLRISTSEIHLGLICRQGAWDQRVYGNGITGEVTQSQTTGNQYRVALRLKMIPGMFTGNSGTAEYVLQLQRNDTKLEGTFEGQHNGQAVRGRAVGMRYRPVATPNL
jgi:hypothetical protein